MGKKKAAKKIPKTISIKSIKRTTKKTEKKEKIYPKYGAEEYANYWRFWTWQYTCRNPEYIKAHDEWEAIYSKLDFSVDAKSQHKLENREKYSDFIEMCHSKFGCFAIKPPSEDSSADRIIRESFEGILNTKTQGFARQVYDHDAIRGEDDPDILSYKINLNKPLDDILAEVTYWYNVNIARKSNDYYSKEGHKKYKAKRNAEHAKIVKHFLNKDERFRLDNESRAIGLWLRDYIHDNKVSIRKAYRDLDSKIDLKGYDRSVGFHAERDPEYIYRNINRYYQNALKCIESMAVLPIANESRSK